MIDFGADPAFAASPSSRFASRPSGLQSGLGPRDETERSLAILDAIDLMLSNQGTGAAQEAARRNRER